MIDGCEWSTGRGATNSRPAVFAVAKERRRQERQPPWSGGLPCHQPCGTRVKAVSAVLAWQRLVQQRERHPPGVNCSYPLSFEKTISQTVFNWSLLEHNVLGLQGEAQYVWMDDRHTVMFLRSNRETDNPKEKVTPRKMAMSFMFSSTRVKWEVRFEWLTKGTKSAVRIQGTHHSCRARSDCYWTIGMSYYWRK